MKKGLAFRQRIWYYNLADFGKTKYGRLAQLVEHLLDVQEVTGSSPVPSTTSPDHSVWGFFCGGRHRTRTARPRRRRGNQSPSRALISARFPTRRNVYRDDCRPVVDGTGLEQQRRRPLPAAETGRSCWGSVRIFQSPAKGLRKNQLTQPVALLSPRFPTRRNVYRDDYRPVVDGTGLEQGGSALSSLQISLYRGCSFLGECDILGLVQQIQICGGNKRGR